MVQASFVALGLVAGGYLVGRGDGIEAAKAAEVRRAAKAAKVVAKVEKGGVEISADVAGELAAAQGRIAALTAQLKEKVPAYVTAEADRRCVVPDGYVRLRDAAGAGLSVVPPAAGGSVDADTGLVLSDLAANDLVNAAAFNACVAEVKAWRGWYPRQAALGLGR
ncbi:hypothetical protein SGCZBJ_12515 [Caulobacter zeae]|uniref:Uncharacterized protein n=1 Tax=Caulobacter zeae TaxID=2055137 RepID=A0A2N5DG57_9CAUL|nr:hypothetical protein SGCZBJ_12515 [Caulobacter zeae]